MDSAKFNLSDLREEADRWVIAQGVTLLVIAIAIAAGTVYVILRGLELLSEIGPGDSTREIGWAFAIAVIGAFTSYVIFSNFLPCLPGATSISVDNLGVGLTYSNSHEEFWRWDSPRLRVELGDYSMQPDWTSPKKLYWVERPPLIPVLGVSHRRTYLTRDAMDQILSVARNLGLSIETSGSGDRNLPGTPIIHRITR